MNKIPESIQIMKQKNRLARKSQSHIFIELSWYLSDHRENGIMGKGWLNLTRVEGSTRKKKQNNGNWEKKEFYSFLISIF